jgi:hypothetical protein
MTDKTPTPQKDMKVLLQMNEQLATTNAKLERSLAAAQAALRELVELKDLHDKIEREVQFVSSTERMEYTIRKPAAWEAARKLVTPQEGERDD